MNTQEILRVEKKPPGNKSLSIEEIFYTLQGEGPFSGEAAVFVRLAGCNLRCSPCDTFFSSHIPSTVDEIIKDVIKIKPKHCKLCVVTGGEPFRQWNMTELLEELLKEFDTVQIETSGSCYQNNFDSFKWRYGKRIQVVCSPKTVKLHPEIIKWIDAYKYVVRAGCVAEDGLPDEEPQHFKKVKVARPAHNFSGDRWALAMPTIYISPWDEKDPIKNQQNIQAAVQSCLNHGYHLSLQIHKIVNLP